MLNCECLWLTSVQLPTSAVNMTLLAFVAECNLLLCTMLWHRRGWLGDSQLPMSIDISCQHGAQQQTRCSGMQRANDGTDRWTDGQTLDSFIDPAAHSMRAVSVKFSISVCHCECD